MLVSRSAAARWLKRGMMGLAGVSFAVAAYDCLFGGFSFAPFGVRISSWEAYKPFRKCFDHWASIPGQAGTFKPASTVPLKDVYEWLPPFLRDRRYVPGMREYLANSGAGVREDETCAARVYIEAINTIDVPSSLRETSCWSSEAHTLASNAHGANVTKAAHVSASVIGITPVWP